MTRRAPGWRWLHPRSPKVRPRTKAAPRPRRTPRPAPALARGRPLDPPLVLYADAPGGPAPCWRAILRTLLKKLLVAAPPRPSERMRPGRGRKRSSSSWLIGIDVGGQHKNTTKTIVVPRKAAQTLTFARERHCAAFWTVPRAVSQPVCRPRYFRAMAQGGAIRFNLALRPFHCLRPPIYRCLGIIALKSAHRIDRGPQRGRPLAARATNSDAPLSLSCECQPCDGSSPERSAIERACNRPFDCGRYADEVLSATTAKSGARIHAVAPAAMTTPWLTGSPPISDASAAT